MRRLVVVAVLAVGLLGGGAVLIRPATPSSSTSTVESADSIAVAEARLARVPGDWLAWAQLGMAYVQRARVDGDPSGYPRAESALNRSLAIRPANAPALTGLGALAAARHDFPLALRHGQEATAADPYSAAAHGVVCDALVELGRYDEADAALQRMVDLRPDTGSYARASYLFELRGRTGAARGAMELALRAAATPDDIAFARQHLASLAFDSGDTTSAMSHVDEGLRAAPDSAGLRVLRARLAAAQGALPEAAAELRAVVDRLPLPEYAALLGDVLSALGDPAAAAAYRLVDAQAELAFTLDVAGHAADRTVLDRVPLPVSAVPAALAEYENRPSVTAADTVAWVLYAAGRHREALSYADSALRLGTRSAIMLHHRGAIRLAVGDRAGARADLAEALRLNPAFSVRYAPLAREVVNET